DEAVKVNSFLFDHTHKVMGGGSASVPVTSVSLTTSGITIKAGESTSLTAIVQPSNATNKEVTWSSSATGVATVDENGVVSGLSAGNSTITATTDDGDFTASLLVTVEPTDNLIINPEFDQGMTGWTLYDYTGDGNSAAVVQNGGMSGSNSLHVDITSSNDVGWRIQLAQHLNFLFELGKTYEISFVAKAESPRTIRTAITGSPSGATWWAPNTINLTTTPQTVGPFQFTVTNSNMENETEFRLDIYMAYGIVSDVWIDKVVIKDISQGGAVAGVEITPDTLRLVDGQSAILTAEVVPANAANQDLSWTSDDPSVATVTPSGSATEVAPGKTKIRATSEDGGHSDASVNIVKPGGSNLIRNHEFDDGLEGWTFRDWTSAGGNTASVVEAEGFSGGKVAYVDIVSDDASGWTINLNQSLDGLIEVGRTYEISFMAKAETPRDISVSIQGSPSNAARWQEHVTLDTIPRQYGPFTFPCNNVGTDTRFSAIFILAKGVISDVWIDKVIINDITDGAGVVSGVSITPELILTNGQTAGLAKSIMPSNAANQNVNWISSNTAV